MVFFRLPIVAYRSDVALDMANGAKRKFLKKVSKKNNASANNLRENLTNKCFGTF